MKRVITPAPQAATALVTAAWDAVGACFERFCLTAGVATLTRMMEEDATALCGQRHERMPKAVQTSVRRTLRQAWELDDADKAEKLIRNLARRLDHDAPGVRDSILEGLDEILTVNRLGLPAELRRSLACTNIIENMNGTVRRVCRNVKHWRDAAMALRWTGAAMMEAAKGFRRLKAHRQLPILKAALAAHGAKHAINPVLERQSAAA